MGLNTEPIKEFRIIDERGYVCTVSNDECKFCWCRADEVEQLRRLLKLAVEDMKHIADEIKEFGVIDERGYMCNVHYSNLNDYSVGRCEVCKCLEDDSCNDDCNFRWRYADEAEKILEVK